MSPLSRRVGYVLFAFILLAGCAHAERLVWDANQDSGLTIGYKVHRGEASRAYSTVVNVGLVTEYSLVGLDDTKTYYFAVTAYSATLESGYSNEAIRGPPVVGIASATDLRITWQEITQKMAISFVASAANKNDGSVSSLACSTTLNVATGDFLVGWITWEDSAETLTSVTDGASNTLTMEATTRSGNGSSSYACFGVKLTATAAATATFTATWSGNISFPRIIVLQFRPDASETQTVDQKNTATGNSGTSPYTSGAITTTGTDEVVIGAIKHYNSQQWTGATIGDVAVDGFIQIAETEGVAAIGYKNTTGTVHADFAKSGGNTNYWVCNIISIKSEAAGGGATASVTETLNFAEALD